MKLIMMEYWLYKYVINYKCETLIHNWFYKCALYYDPCKITEILSRHWQLNFDVQILISLHTIMKGHNTENKLLQEKN